MIGNNEIHINTATMAIAVQEHLKRIMPGLADHLKVTKVEEGSNGFVVFFSVSDTALEPVVKDSK